jgi:hypothetical protein
MHNPREPHLTAMKRIICYLQGTLEYNLILRRSTNSNLVVYTDADWSVVQTHTVLRQAIRCSWGTTWYPGRPSGRPSSPAPALRPSIVPLPTAWLRPLSYVSCSASSRPRRLGAPLSTATISASCTYPPTPFNINAPSMWRLIFILSERRLSSVKSASSMSRRHRSSPTSSRRDSPPRCLMSFGSVSTSAVAEL